MERHQVNSRRTSSQTLPRSHSNRRWWQTTCGGRDSFSPHRSILNLRFFSRHVSRVRDFTSYFELSFYCKQILQITAFSTLCCLRVITLALAYKGDDFWGSGCFWNGYFILDKDVKEKQGLYTNTVLLKDDKKKIKKTCSTPSQHAC